MAALPEKNTYHLIADEYAQSVISDRRNGFNYSTHLLIPRLLEVIGGVDGMTVLDAGCGEGIVSRSLKGKALTMVGIDVEPRLIEYARKRDKTRSIEYLVRDLSQPMPQYANAFDLIVSNLVMNDVPDHIGFIKTLCNCLKSSGRIVLSMNNPYSALLRERVKSYFDSGVSCNYKFGPVSYYHRTMEEYLTNFNTMGMMLKGLFDVRVTEEMFAEMPQSDPPQSWHTYHTRFPFMVILDLVKTTR